jgi:hypothetical protein
MKDLPIIFLLGPSGVGKDYVATLLTKQIPILFLDFDIRHPFGHYGLRKEWSRLITEFDPQPFAAALRARNKDANPTRLLLSFGSRCVLTRKHLDAAATVGIQAVLLWGPKDLCRKAAIGRNDGRVTAESKYNDANKVAFETYSSVEFDPIRVEVFRADGSHRRDEDLLNDIRKLMMPNNREALSFI